MSFPPSILSARFSRKGDFEPVSYVDGHRISSRIGPMALECCQDASVVFTSRFHHRRVVTMAIRREDPCKDVRVAHRPNHRLVAGGFDDQHVEGEIRVFEVLDGAFSDRFGSRPTLLGKGSHAFIVLTDLIELVSFDSLGSPGRGVGLERLSHFIEFDQFLGADLANNGTKLRDEFDESFVGELADCLPHRSGTDSQFPANRSIANSGPREKVAVDQSIP